MFFVKQLAIIVLVTTAGNLSTANRIGYSSVPSSSSSSRLGNHEANKYYSVGYSLATSASSGYPIQQKIEDVDTIEQRPIHQQTEQQHQIDNNAEEELNNDEDSVVQQGNYASYRAGYSPSYGYDRDSSLRVHFNQPTTTPAPKDFGEILPDELPAQELLAPAPLPTRKPKPKLQLFPTEQKPQQNSEAPATGEEQSKFVDFQHIKYGEIPLTSSVQDYSSRNQNYASPKLHSFRKNNNHYSPSAAYIAQQPEQSWQSKPKSSYGAYSSPNTFESVSQKSKKALGIGTNYNSYSASEFSENGYGHSSSQHNYNGENIKAAVQTYHTVEYKEVPIEQQELKPIMIEIPASDNTVSLHFKSRSSQLNIRQKHESGKGSVQETSSEDEPQILRHIVTKPIYQEIREVIKPMRKITQEIRPVKEEIQTIVAKANKSKSKSKNNLTENVYSTTDNTFTNNKIQQKQQHEEEQVKEQAHYDNDALQEVTDLSDTSSTESSLSASTKSVTDLTGFDDIGSTEASDFTQKQTSSYSASSSSSPSSYSSSVYDAQKPFSTSIYGARKSSQISSSSNYDSSSPSSSNYDSSSSSPSNYGSPKSSSGYNVKGQNISLQRNQIIGRSVPFARMAFTMGSAANKQQNSVKSIDKENSETSSPRLSRNSIRKNSVLGRSAALFEHDENNHQEQDIGVTPAPRQRFVPSAAPGSSDHEIIEDELENAELHVPLPESLQSAASNRSYRKALRATYKARQSRNVQKQRLYRTSIN